jgi:dTDP-4-dehydrorhamnose reductase
MLNSVMLGKPRVLILGSTGFLGSALVHGLNAEIVTTDRSILDLTKPLTESFREFIKSKEFDYIVISAARYT